MTRFRSWLVARAFDAGVFLLVFFALQAAFGIAHGQSTLSISNQNTPPAGGYAPGAVVPLIITKTGNPTATGFEFDIAVSAGTIAGSAGPALPAGKFVSCSPAPPLSCIAIGLDDNSIPDGAAMVLSVTLPANISSSPVTVTISNPVESDPNGSSLPTVIGNPTVSLSIKNGCDVNGDGSVSSADLSVVVNAALAHVTSTTTDLNKDGKTNVLDAQIVATAGTAPAFTCNAK